MEEEEAAQEEEEEEEEGKEEGRQLISETTDPKARSAAASFLWRGLRLGKKVAIAGAAISSAPVVIPPLIVGLAFAFPFGVYFAGFTYTDKVMRALLSTPANLVVPDEIDVEEEEKQREIEIWPPTATLDTEKEGEGERAENETEMPPRIDHSLTVVERSGNDLGIETTGPRTIVVTGDDEVPRGLGEGGQAKKEMVSTENGHDEVEGDEPNPVTAERDIELWPPTSNLDIPRDESNNIERPGTGDERCAEEVRGMTLDSYDTEQDVNINFGYTSSINRKDMLREIGTVEGEKLMQVERGVEENEERREREERENEKGIINNEHETGISDHPYIVSDYRQIASGNMEDGEEPIESTGKEERKISEEEDEILGLATAVPNVKQYPKNTPPYAALMPKDSDSETEQTMFSAKYAYAVKNGKETVVNKVKQPAMTFDGSVEGIEDVPPSLEAKELLSTLHHSLAAVPEEHGVDLKLPGLNTELALSSVSSINGGGTETVDERKTMKRIGSGQTSEIDEVQMNRQDGVQQTESNYVVTTVVSVECKHVVEQSAVEQNRNESRVETLELTVESKKDEGVVMGERNAEHGRSAATPEENLVTVYHSIVSTAPLESKSERVPSSLSTEYASAVEGQSTDMTDAMSGPTAIIVETARVVHFDDEVLYNEEMMWEQIYAMRTIVGCKAALCSSLVEELKALYLFTGVEPPVSLMDTSDVMEIGDKLNFLKSVIGVE